MYSTGRPGDDRVEAGRAHAGAAELQLAGRHLGDDLGAAGEPHGLHVDAGRRQVAVGEQEERGEGIRRDVADLHRGLGLGPGGGAAASTTSEATAMARDILM